jgi:succinyl-CoA synthetase beta subunit
MKLHEYQAQRILTRYGVPVPGGKVAASVNEVRQIAAQLGNRVVLKAQVLTGGRGRAGGIRLVDNAAEAEELAGTIFGLDIHGYTASRILVNEAIDIEREVYLGVALDRYTGQPVVLASAESDIEIEQVARDTPERVQRIHVDPLLGLRAYQVRELAYNVGLERELTSEFVSIAIGLYRAFVDNDALLVEINPLAVCANGRMISVDAQMIVDDNALFRHPDLASMRDETQETWAKQLARRYSIDYVRLGGNVACLANGAGLAMATMDLLRTYNTRPSSFIDFGSGPKAERVRVALQLALINRPQALLVNIFGGVTSCDEVAQGILMARDTLPLSTPVVVRLAGWNAQQGRERLKQSGIHVADSSVSAVEKVVELVRQSPGGIQR